MWRFPPSSITPSHFTAETCAGPFEGQPKVIHHCLAGRGQVKGDCSLVRNDAKGKIALPMFDRREAIFYHTYLRPERQYPVPHCIQLVQYYLQKALRDRWCGCHQPFELDPAKAVHHHIDSADDRIQRLVARPPVNKYLVTHPDKRLSASKLR